MEDTNEYYANNILVHNCMAQCYWRVGIERFAEAESYGAGKQNDNLYPIKEAPAVDEKGNMTGFILTYPENPKKSDDWRYN